MGSMTVDPQRNESGAESSDPLVKRYRPQPAPAAPEIAKPVPEVGGRKDGTDPTRYGDWEKNGRCIDF
jgi:hypothetical protein